jgi:transaldolase
MNNPLLQLHNYGQSIWLDYIRRDLIHGGELRRLISEDGLSGMTSNPTLFEEAITKSSDYDADIRKFSSQGKKPEEIYDLLTQKDVADAADVFHDRYNRSNGREGYVSLEVNPKLAYETDATIAEAHRLWQAVRRPNIMIKVPATKEGLPAIEQLTSEGVNVNITLLFGIRRYQSVAKAYFDGLNARKKAGMNINDIFSVASFFLSRIDVLLDPMIEKIPDAAKRNSLHGEIAIASAQIAYKNYRDIFYGAEFGNLRSEGGRTQQVLWASTSTKNPAYSDVKYVEPLIGPETINTLPKKTIDAYRDHGQPQIRLDAAASAALEKFRVLKEAGISIDAATDQLEREGVEKFIQAYDKALDAVQKKCFAAKNSDGSAQNKFALHEVSR